MTDLRISSSITAARTPQWTLKNRTPSVVVAVLTYGRTADLAETIAALAHECTSIPDAGLLVVDNNPEPEAEPVVRAMADKVRPCPVIYVYEKNPGIAAARNRAIQQTADARLLVFVDDDERPTEGWLSSLVALYESESPAAIAGPVISQFATSVDPWITAGRFFVRRRMPTGSPITVAATNNLLLDVAQMRSLRLEFDRRFGMTGGEDTLFTRQLVQRGGRMLWCDEAVVIDKVPRARASRGWVLRKAFSMGNCRARVDVALARTRPARGVARARDALGGIARVALGALRAGLGTAVHDVHHQALGTRMAVTGVGMFLGAVGYSHVHYSRPGVDGGRRRSRITGPDRG